MSTSPSDLLFYGLADAVGVSVKIRTVGGGSINHEFDSNQIKQLRAALTPNQYDDEISALNEKLDRILNTALG